MKAGPHRIAHMSACIVIVYGAVQMASKSALGSGLA